MTPTRADLLRDVAAALIASGEAVLPQPKRPYVRRGEQIAELARDMRIGCAPRSAGSVALIEDAMYRYSVTRRTAQRIAQQARKMREGNNGRV